MRATQSQFALLIDFMERNGDISKYTQDAKGRMENLKKWHELTDILNSGPGGESKSLEKWRKTWSDFKNNTRKKINKIEKLGMGPELTDVEKRVLYLIDEKRGSERRALHLNVDSDVILKTEKNIDHQESLSPPPGIFCDVDSGMKRRTSSYSSYSSSSSSSHSSGKRSRLNTNRSKSIEPKDSDDMKEIAYKFLEFEKERDKMAHEREMARIKQNDQLIFVFGKIVTIMESLAPSIKRYLDKETNEGR